MARKIFIVAKGNDTIYTSLMRSVGHEPGVEIVYDRRATPRRSALRRLVAGASRRRGGSRGAGDDERRVRTSVDEEIRRRGWAVVRRE